MTQIVSDGLSIAATGYLIVFLALLLFYGVFYALPKVLSLRTRKHRTVETEGEKTVQPDNLSGGELAAISTAIYLYMNDQHDQESYDVTIKNIKRRYSPWSSKIYAMNNILKK